MECLFSIDVEKDLYLENYNGITKGISRLLLLLEKHQIKATFFITGEALEKFPKLIKNLSKQGHEIALHGYSHLRLDTLPKNLKKSQIVKSKKAYRKVLKKMPLGFRAPQFSIDSESFIILKKEGFKYDSSYSSGNILLLRHLFKRRSAKSDIIKNFLGIQKMPKGLEEYPRKSLLISLGAFEIKILPLFLIKLILALHKTFRINIHLITHSWDFINIETSRTNKICNSEKFLLKLNILLSTIKEDFKFIKYEDLIKKQK